MPEGKRPRDNGRRTPTPEQQAIRDHALTHPDEGRKCVAFAGSGKTTTLEMLSGDRPEPGVYVAFNRAIKQEAARRFPRHIKVTTAHAAAYGALRMHEQQARLDRRLFGDAVRHMVRLPRCRMPEDALGQVVLDSVARFCNSADPQLTIDHVALDPREPEDIRLAALAGAQALWARMADRQDDCPITHDTYLKLWQLGDARLRGFEWALFDEAQDASPVMVDVMVRQGIPITWVGDPHQQIYAWRGAVNAMRVMPGAEFPLTMSFRFGQAVADAANAVLRLKPESLRPLHQIVGNPARASQIGRLPRGTRHAFLSRTNAEWFQEALRFQGRVHVIGGIDETERLLLGAWGLWRHNARPERCPAIARFATWAQLCEHADRFDDRELSFARRIVEQYRERLPAAVAGLRARHVEHEDDALLVLSTAHKAKGREFDFVRLGSGFTSPLDEEWRRMTPQAQEAELNLLYVALTRAIQGLEPNMAVSDCLTLASGVARPGQRPPPQRLPEIRIERPAVPATAPATTSPSTPPARRPALDAAASGRAPSSGIDARAGARPWTAEDDAEALRMAGQGFSAEDVSGWLDRHPAAVAVRLAVLGTPGTDSNLSAEILAALASPAGPTPAAPTVPPPGAKPRLEPARPQDDGLGPMDFLDDFPPIDGDDGGDNGEPAEDYPEELSSGQRARFASRRPFGR